MPSPGSNRRYRAWSYIEPLMLMMYGGGDLRETREDRALRRMGSGRGLESSKTAKTGNRAG